MSATVLVTMDTTQAERFEDWVKGHASILIDDRNTFLTYTFVDRTGVEAFRNRWKDRLQDLTDSPPYDYSGLTVEFGSVMLGVEMMIHRWIKRHTNGARLAMETTFCCEVERRVPAFTAQVERLFNARTRVWE